MAIQPDMDAGAPRSQTPIDQEDDGMPTPDGLPGNNAVSPTLDQVTTAQEEDPRNGILQPGAPDVPDGMKEEPKDRAD
jgi:hypothetical protein